MDHQSTLSTTDTISACCLSNNAVADLKQTDKQTLRTCIFFSHSPLVSTLYQNDCGCSSKFLPGETLANAQAFEIIYWHVQCLKYY